MYKKVYHFNSNEYSYNFTMSRELVSLERGNCHSNGKILQHIEVTGNVMQLHGQQRSYTLNKKFNLDLN